MSVKICFSERQHAIDTSYGVWEITCPYHPNCAELSETLNTGGKKTINKPKGLKKKCLLHFFSVQATLSMYPMVSTQDFNHSDALNVNEDEMAAVKQVRGASAKQQLAACHLQKFNIAEIS